MSRTDNRKQETLSDRLKGLIIVAIVLAIIHGVNEVLWLFDTIVIMLIVTILMPIKFFVIVFRTWQLWITDDKKLTALFFGFVILVAAFFFDFRTVPELWAYRLGVETQGKAIEFRDKGNSEYIVYEFSVGQSIYRKEQRVSFSLYKSLEPGAVVPLKYLASFPAISFLVDPRQLKFQTVLVLFMGLAAIASLYASVIKEKVSIFMKNNLQFPKPA